jgi:hypothetical protein
MCVIIRSRTSHPREVGAWKYVHVFEKAKLNTTTVFFFLLGFCDLVCVFGDELCSCQVWRAPHVDSEWEEWGRAEFFSFRDKVF